MQDLRENIENGGSILDKFLVSVTLLKDKRPTQTLHVEIPSSLASGFTLKYFRGSKPRGRRTVSRTRSGYH